ncbi:cyclin-L1 isoform X1 [Octopus bimaculoides]|uniref:Cyclin-like domain-containing protein n=1 Tax=Octopus bimaculoides TaxID=37653 RepID=A0A0L8FNF0_OCTBM|nr:cyclin-L1 isoform X1 [Octopus bimaculoides]|eukprot:XP_014788497.1 PREDICTED: cyclin-L1-like [Octopus bimaculoides]
MSENKQLVSSRRTFSKVVITLENILLPEERLSPTPSMQDGLAYEVEIDLRIIGCEMIQTAGILLKLPQVAMATGQVLFQRFYYSKSFVKHNMEVVAMACMNLASKIEECPRRIRDTINVFHHIKQLRSGKTIHPMVLDQNYINLKNQVIKAERRVLKELGFCVHFKYPHKMIVMYLQVLECEKNQKLVQCAWNYMNDSFRTNVFVRYHPETIACACIYLAARQLQIPLPNSPHWFWLFDVTEEQIKAVSLTILRLYARKKANCDELEKIVAEHRRIQVEAKLKAKNQKSGNGTPNSTISRPASPKLTCSPVTSSAPTKAKSKDERVQSDHSSDDPAPHNHVNKRRRSLSRSDKSLSDSNSKSRSRSERSFSHSHSRSPANKNKRYRTPPRKYRSKDKYSPERYVQKEKHTHKRNKRRSYSRSRSRSFSQSPEHRRAGHKKYYRERDHYPYNHSPDNKQYKKHRNHRSPSYERYDKYKR